MPWDISSLICCLRHSITALLAWHLLCSITLTLLTPCEFKPIHLCCSSGGGRHTRNRNQHWWMLEIKGCIKVSAVAILQTYSAWLSANPMCLQRQVVPDHPQQEPVNNDLLWDTLNLSEVAISPVNTRTLISLLFDQGLWIYSNKRWGSLCCLCLRESLRVYISGNGCIPFSDHDWYKQHVCYNSMEIRQNRGFLGHYPISSVVVCVVFVASILHLWSLTHIHRWPAPGVRPSAPRAPSPATPRKAREKQSRQHGRPRHAWCSGRVSRARPGPDATCSQAWERMSGRACLYHVACTKTWTRLWARRTSRECRSGRPGSRGAPREMAFSDRWSSATIQIRPTAPQRRTCDDARPQHRAYSLEGRQSYISLVWKDGNERTSEETLVDACKPYVLLGRIRHDKRIEDAFRDHLCQSMSQQALYRHRAHVREQRGALPNAFNDLPHGFL